MTTSNPLPPPPQHLLNHPPQPLIPIRVYRCAAFGAVYRSGPDGGGPFDVGGEERLAAMGASDDDSASNHCCTVL